MAFHGLHGSIKLLGHGEPASPHLVARGPKDFHSPRSRAKVAFSMFLFGDAAMVKSQNYQPTWPKHGTTVGVYTQFLSLSERFRKRRWTPATRLPKETPLLLEESNVRAMDLDKMANSQLPTAWWSLFLVV